MVRIRAEAGTVELEVSWRFKHRPGLTARNARTG